MYLNALTVSRKHKFHLFISECDIVKNGNKYHFPLRITVTSAKNIQSILGFNNDIKTQTVTLNNLIFSLRFKVYKFKMKRFGEIEFRIYSYKKVRELQNYVRCIDNWYTDLWFGISFF